MNKTYIFASFVSIFLLLSSALSAQAGMTNAEHSALAKQMLEQHIRPGYDRLLKQSQTLESKIKSLCASPSKEQKAAVDTAFFAAIKELSAKVGDGVLSGGAFL